MLACVRLKFVRNVLQGGKAGSGGRVASTAMH